MLRSPPLWWRAIGLVRPSRTARPRGSRRWPVRCRTERRKAPDIGDL